MQTLIIQHDYPLRPARLWAIATDCATFGKSVGDAPESRAATGRILRLPIGVLGILRPHVVEVSHCDDARMILRLRERGRAGHRWGLTLAVTPAGNGSRLTERIELQAGLMTPILSFRARLYCARRHAARLRLIARQDGPA